MVGRISDEAREAGLRMLRATLLRECLWLNGHVPGSPEYQRYRRSFMPIGVHVGEQLSEQADSCIWYPGREANGFLMVTGGSGSGKTEALKTIASSIAEHGIPIVTVDFHGDVIFPGQNTVILHPGYSLGALDPRGLNPLAVDQAGWLGLGPKVTREVERIGRASGGLGYKQEACLRYVLTDLYNTFGIVDHDLRSFYARPPTLADLAERLWLACQSGLDGFERQVLMACFSKVERLASIGVFQRQQRLTVDDMCRYNLRMDCSLLEGGARLLVVEIVLEMIFEACKAVGPIPVKPESDADRFRVFIMIDEVKILSHGRGDPNKSNLILNTLATQARKFGVGLILASQMNSHFSEEVRANFAAHLAMKRMDPGEARKVAPRLEVTVQDLISSESPPGVGYLRSASTGGTVLLRANQCPAMPAGQINGA